MSKRQQPKDSLKESTVNTSISTGLYGISSGLLALGWMDPTGSFVFLTVLSVIKNYAIRRFYAKR